MLRRLLVIFFACSAIAAAQNTLPERTLDGVRIREQWIPMRDGVNLAANLFFPSELKPGARVPVVLEYLPYRKDDWSVGRDYSLHSYFVRHDYVVARVDVRGTGRSHGRTPDREYSDQELRDGEDVIAWLARQPWSNGNVGMMGISWGGFNAIQMAMRQPPALKAILAADASDDLYHDDIHYIDGMMHVDEFEISMDLTNALSPAPDFPIDEKTLADRFDTPPWFLTYLQHQRDGAFWQRASLAMDYTRIKVPVFLIGGFLDGYRDSVPRMLADLSVPRTAIVGPWPHSFPNDAEPGPDIAWRNLATEFWDHWLKDKPNNVEQWPMLRVYLRQYYPPGTDIKNIPGEWRTTNWPSQDVYNAQYYLASNHRLSERERTGAENTLPYAPATGVQGGFWWGDLTVDQRPFDEKSLVYDTNPLEAPVAILGLPGVDLFTAASAPLADWFVRLEDVAPDGSSQLVTAGGLNGAQRDARSDPTDLQPGKFYFLEVPMRFTSWTFPVGHRIRLAISNAMWPMIWPTPYSMTMTLKMGDTNASMLTLPIVSRSVMPTVTFARPAPEETMPGVHSEGDVLPGEWTTKHDGEKRTTTVDWHGDEKDFYPWGEEDTHERLAHTVHDDDPANAAVHGEASMLVKLKDRTLLWSTTLELTSDVRDFYYTYTRELRNDGAVVRTRTWHATIPRDHQ